MSVNTLLAAFVETITPIRLFQCIEGNGFALDLFFRECLKREEAILRNPGILNDSYVSRTVNSSLNGI